MNERKEKIKTIELNGFNINFGYNKEFEANGNLSYFIYFEVENIETKKKTNGLGWLAFHLDADGNIIDFKYASDSFLITKFKDKSFFTKEDMISFKKEEEVYRKGYEILSEYITYTKDELDKEFQFE